MNTLNVPFRPNVGERCNPTTAGMVMDYFTPDQALYGAELDCFCGYYDDVGSWPTKHMLGFAAMGYEVDWSEAFDLRAFAADPLGYLRTVFEGPALEYQLNNTTPEILEAEAWLARQYLAAGLPYNDRPGTIEEVQELSAAGWLVRMEVDACTLARTDGVYGHSVLVLGGDERQAVVHNPDSVHGNRPNVPYTWDHLYEAWQNCGGTFGMTAYRYGVVEQPVEVRQLAAQAIAA